MNWLVNYNPMDKIIDGLYLGNISAASDLKMLYKNGITHIVRVLKGNFGKVYYDKFNYKIIQIDDLPNQNLQKYFDSAHKFIDEALSENTEDNIKNKVLVHCQVGMSRSATIVIGYLLRKFPEMTLSKAHRFVKSKRPIVNPNDGFMRQLKSFERILEKNRKKARFIGKTKSESPTVVPTQTREQRDQGYVQKSDNFTKSALPRDPRIYHNYHYTRGISSNGTHSKADIHSKMPSMPSNFNSRHPSLGYGSKYYGNSFLEQNLKLSRPSILQQSGIDLTKSLKPSGHYSDINGSIKNQQMFSSPAPTNKYKLLEEKKEYPYIKVPPYMNYMSPQRPMKTGLLDENSYHPPSYK
jgi:protein-tyrosine phosphatase